MSGAIAAELNPMLLDVCTVIAPDSPGYGQSPVAESVGDLAGYASVIPGFRDEVKVERCVIVGTGLGAVLATAVAARFG